MNADRIIDAISGDKESKDELKRAFKKSHNLAGFVAVTVCMLMIFFLFIVLPNTFSLFDSFDSMADNAIIFFMKGISIVVLSMMAYGITYSFSTHSFTKHLKITLPESIAPHVKKSEKKKKHFK